MSQDTTHVLKRKMAVGCYENRIYRKLLPRMEDLIWRDLHRDLYPASENLVYRLKY